MGRVAKAKGLTNLRRYRTRVRRRAAAGNSPAEISAMLGGAVTLHEVQLILTAWPVQVAEGEKVKA